MQFGEESQFEDDSQTNRLLVRKELRCSDCKQFQKALAYEMMISDSLMTENIALRHLLDDSDMLDKGKLGELVMARRTDCRVCSEEIPSLENQIRELRDINVEAQQNLEMALESIRACKEVEEKCRLLESEKISLERDFEAKIESMRNDFITTLDQCNTKWKQEQVNGKGALDEDNFFKAKELMDELEAIKSENIRLKDVISRSQSETKSTYSHPESKQHQALSQGWPGGNMTAQAAFFIAVSELKEIVEKHGNSNVSVETCKSVPLLATCHSSLILAVKGIISNKDDRIRKLLAQQEQIPKEGGVPEGENRDVDILSQRCSIEAALKEAYKEIVQKIKTWSDDEELVEALDALAGCCEEIAVVQTEAARLRKKIGEFLTLKDYGENIDQEHIEQSKSRLMSIGQKTSELHQVKAEVELKLEQLLNPNIRSECRRNGYTENQVKPQSISKTERSRRPSYHSAMTSHEESARESSQRQALQASLEESSTQMMSLKKRLAAVKQAINNK